jgi:hypothetical protein
MQPMDRALAMLVKQNLVDIEVAAAKAHNQEDFRKLCGVSI